MCGLICVQTAKGARGPVSVAGFLVPGSTGDDIVTAGTGGVSAATGAMLFGKAGKDVICAGDRLQFASLMLTGIGTFKASNTGLSIWMDESVANVALTCSDDADRAEPMVSSFRSSWLIDDFQSGDLGIAIPSSPAPVANASSFAANASVFMIGRDA